MWAAFQRFALRAPIACGGISLGLRYGVGDFLGQNIEHYYSGKPRSTYSHNWKRTIAFAGFGAFYGSGPGYLVYNTLYPALIGPGRPFLTAVIDITINCPFIYFPSFYVAKELIMSQPTAIIHNTRGVLKDAFARWRNNFKDDFIACTAIWFPMNYFNFRYIPLQFRLPFMSAVGMIWVGILSVMRGSEKVEIQSSLPVTVPIRQEAVLAASVASGTQRVPYVPLLAAHVKEK